MIRNVVPFISLGLVLCAACGDDGVPMTDSSTDASTDSSTDADMCGEASAAFSSFVSANDSCENNGDCTIVGDCGPNADFTAVRADAADEAFRLMQMRCHGIFDGPTYRATCTSGSCSAERDGMFCGMPAVDSGVDATLDAGPDATTDGG